MFFTKEDYEKIELYLKLNAKKDTDFPITTAVTDDDYIAIILNDLNRIISIKNLRESIFSGISASISVSPNTIYAATSTEVTIEVLVNKVASSITLYRNLNLIEYVLNSNFLLVEENIIAPAGTEITYKAVIVAEGIEEPLIRQFTLSVKSVPIPDYYVGWTTGENSGLDAFASLSTEQLLAISTDYSGTPTFNKTVSSSEAAGTRQIFFIMWRDESAPMSGSITSGGITENLQAADFTDTNVFRATHADIIIDDVTYHVAGLRGAFDAGDKFVVNF